MSVVSQIPPHSLPRGLQISGGVGALLWAQGVSLPSRLAGDLQLAAGGAPCKVMGRSSPTAGSTQ